MIRIELTLSNEGARAARNEIDSFLRVMNDKMAGAKADKGDTATLAYVVLRGLREKIGAALTEQERQNNEREQEAYRQRVVRGDTRPIRKPR